MSEAMSEDEGRHCRWRRRPESRPDEIIQAALHLFTERGFAATKMEEIAARAGVTKGTVYLYFPSKEDLFRAAVEETLLPSLWLGERMVEEDEGKSQAEMLRALLANWWDVISTPPLSGLPKLVMAEAANFPGVAKFFVEKLNQRGRRIFERVIQRGVERGEFREVDPRIAARLLLAPVVWAMVHMHSLEPFDTPLDLEDHLEVHIDLFLRGILKDSGKDVMDA